MPDTLRIALLIQDKEVSSVLELRLQSKDYQTVILNKPSATLGLLYSDPPGLLLVDLCTTERDNLYKMIKELKSDNYFSMMPIIGILPEKNMDTVDLEECPFDDFIQHPINYPELFSRITLSRHRIQRILDNNPLTRLPGNTSIQQAIEKSLGKPMVVCYLDINNFKAYNDTYGFSRGDEVIRMVARINSNAIKEYCDTGFSGHIGGDDFVFILPIEYAEPVCQRIIDNFDLIVSDLFGEDEKAIGYYIAKNRKGKKVKIPLLSVAIAIVPTDTSHIQHHGMIAEVATELIKQAKMSPQSSYLLDRRKKPE